MGFIHFMSNNISKYIILGLLSHEPCSGYDIKKKVDHSIGYIWDINYGQIYPTLRKLEEEKLAIKKIETSDRGPTRKIYSITESGRKELQKWLFKPEEKEYEIFLKIFFGAQLSPEENIQKLKEFNKKRTQEIKKLEQSKKNLSSILYENNDHLYYLLTTLFGLYDYKIQLKWSEMVIDILKEINNKDIKIEDILDRINER